MRTYIPLALALLLGLAGCGGGGGGNHTSTTDHPTFQIAWPARSKDALSHGLTSAQSVKVTLSHADPSGSDVVMDLDRDASKTEAYTGTYTVPQKVTKTFNSLSAAFYAQPSEGGDVVGTATASVTVDSSSLNLASIVVVGTVKSVAVVDPGTLTVGSGTTQLQASAMDSDGAAVAVTPGSFSWSATEGASNLTVTNDGVATPVAVGTASVTATADGVTSPAQTITVQNAATAGQSFNIDWPDRTRGTLEHSLTSAMSAEVTFVHGRADGGDLVMTANRTSAGLVTYTIPQPLANSVSMMKVKFYSELDKGGSLVGTATAATQVSGDKIAISSVAVDGVIKSVKVVDPGDVMAQGGSIQLEATAYDANGSVVPVTPGSFRWTQLNGVYYAGITKDGSMSAFAPYKVKVKVVIDGVSSDDSIINVVAVAGTKVQPIDFEATALGYETHSGKLYAALPTDIINYYQNCLIALDPQTGAFLNRETTNFVDLSLVDGIPTSLSLTDDGRYAYVGVYVQQGSVFVNVQKVDLSTRKVVATYPINETGRKVVDVAAMPGSDDTFAVVVADTGSANLSIWDGGTLRSGTTLAGSSISWVGPNEIYGKGNGSLYQVSVSSSGASLDEIVANLGDFEVSDGLVYSSNGQVIDPVAKRVISSFPTADILSESVVGISSSANRVYFVTRNATGNVEVVSFDKTTGAEKGVVDTGLASADSITVVPCGEHEIAFLYKTTVNGHSGYIPVLVRDLP